MNKSYSKIRHIQEANEKLDKRFLSEVKTSRQYLSESYNDFGANIPDGPNAYKYFIGLANKTNKLDVGTAWLGKTTYWVVTRPWRSETAMQLEGGFLANLTMRGIVKRGNYFDVSNNNESITSLKLTKDKGGDTNLFIESGDQVDFWIPSTQTLRAVDSGTPGGNMSLVGGLANFKSMVKNNPNKALLLGNFNNVPDIQISFKLCSTRSPTFSLYVVTL